MPVRTLDGTLLTDHEFQLADVNKTYLGADLLENLSAVINLGEGYIDMESLRIPLLTGPDGGRQQFYCLGDIDFIDDVHFLTSDVPTGDAKKDSDTSVKIDKSIPGELNLLLNQYTDSFTGIGLTDLVEHHIPTTDNIPVNLPSYRMPMHLKAKAETIIDEYLQNDIIRPSSSEYCSPVILCKKSDSDGVRVVIDYRALNLKSKKDAFTSPRIDDLTDKLYDANVFTKLDIKAAYHNIKIAEEDRHKTAFRFNGKLFEWNRCPFGLSSAPGTFNRLMSLILKDTEEYTASYYDDIIVFSKTETEHLAHLTKILHAIHKSGLKINKDKCKFFTESVNFLGFTISNNSITVSDSKTRVIREYPVPKTTKQVKRFLGLTGFYRKLIPDYSLLSIPLNKMMLKHAVFVWNSDCQHSFDKLKYALCSEPVLRIPHPDYVFIVKVDSSKLGVGCILEQEHPETKERYVIEYGSLKYSDAQKRYPAIELEVCGLIFAIKHWTHYLVGKKFIVETDSRAVQWIKGKRDHLGKLGRWSLFLENFSFSTVHIPGKDHCGADALSRIYDCESSDLCSLGVNKDFIKNIPELFNISDWFKEINNDPQFVKYINNNSILCNNKIYVQAGRNNIIVVPRSFRYKILRLLHDNYGHIGMNKLLLKIKERFFWPNMQKAVKDYCNKCHSCAINKDRKSPNDAPLLPISTATLEPFQKCAIDILGPLPEAEDKSKYVVVLQDYFTKWPEVVALKRVDSDAIINWLCSDIIPRYGVFNELVTDQGVQFVSEKFKSFCKSVGIKQRFTSPFHPQTDGMVERFNRTFLNMLRNYVCQNQKDWPSHIPLIVFSYRSSVNETTKVSPAEALQGRKLKLPIDILRPPNLSFDSNIDDDKNLDNLFEKMKVSREKIRVNSEKALVKRQQNYDNNRTRLIKSPFNVNDHVYWKKPICKKGLSPKLMPIWQGPFIIRSKLSDLNYVIGDETNSSITVHVNNLKLCLDPNVKPINLKFRGRPKRK